MVLGVVVMPALLTSKGHSYALMGQLGRRLGVQRTGVRFYSMAVFNRNYKLGREGYIYPCPSLPLPVSLWVYHRR